MTLTSKKTVTVLFSWLHMFVMFASLLSKKVSISLLLKISLQSEFKDLQDSQPFGSALL